MSTQDSQMVLINAAIAAGLIQAQALPDLKQKARREQRDLMSVVGQAGGFPESALYLALADKKGLPYFDVDDLVAESELLQAFPADLLLRRQFFPVHKHGELYVVISDPDDRSAAETLQRTLGRRGKPALAAPAAIEASIRRFFSLPEHTLSAVTLFDDILREAALRKATDLHFEPLEHSLQVRMRVDGQLQSYPRYINRAMADSLISRIKVLGGLDIAEQNMAQDGGFAHRLPGATQEVEMRVATIPTRWGERATLRILGQGTRNLNLSALGMAPVILEPIQKAVRKPHGIVLVTGPTGSGKSTTLYAALRELDPREVNILTVEDPIEQVIEGIGQVQVSEKVSFAKALRSFLRHDPDVMLVGEIRDFETAETAIRAAMTGHLVLSTLHTNSAVSTISRLADIGCAPFLVAATLEGVVAQRLVRRVCSHCAQRVAVTETQARLLGVVIETTLQKGQGCARCLGSGYRGRVGIYETLWINEGLRRLIRQRADDDVIAEKARVDGLLRTLWEDAREKVLAGVTTLEEAMHFYHEDSLPSAT